MHHGQMRVRRRSGRRHELLEQLAERRRACDSASGSECGASETAAVVLRLRASVREWARGGDEPLPCSALRLARPDSGGDAASSADAGVAFPHVGSDRSRVLLHPYVWAAVEHQPARDP
eukprot:Amastigsp_a682267_8.p4 type:complete len:119 gc:universal Amastigsp_a682267_8:1339-983(-)